MRIYLFVFIALFVSVVDAQYNNVMISNTNSPEEVSICINPKNTNQIVAGANLNNVYYSADGGTTWTVGILTDSVTSVWGDPIIFTDTTGNFYYSHLSNPPLAGWIDRICFQKSTDGGQTWGASTWTGWVGPQAQDKEAIIVNKNTNEIYVTWTQFDSYGSSNPLDSSVILYSTSTDAGQSWSIPIRINKVAGDCVDSDNTVEGAIPMVGPNGEIYVVWQSIAGLVFNKSLDNGVTWLPQETLICAVPGGWDYNITGLQRANGLPQAVVDLSGGPNHGTIYVNWTDQRNGSTDTDVFLVKSTDGGQTWTSPLRVNNDPAGKQQFLTWMTVDQTNGTVYCVFYDRRNYSVSTQQTDVYLAVSTDGGNTFSNYRINQNPFVPSATVFFGDYISISAHNNVVRPIWMQYGSGVLSVWTALIDGTTIGMNEFSLENSRPFQLEQNIPNPFNQNTVISFNLKEAAEVSLSVYDFNGKCIAKILENEKYKSGSFDYVLNAERLNLNPGIYFYTLSCGEFSLSKKMIVY